MTWTDAAATCELLGAHLASIASLGENDAVQGLLMTGPTNTNVNDLMFVFVFDV